MENNYLYFYENQRPITFTILAYVILFYSLISLINTPLFSFFLALGATGFLSYKRGIEINFLSNEYRNVKAFGPQFLGSWSPLPPLNYISVFKQKLAGKIYGRSGNAISQEMDIIEVKLVTNQNKTISLFATKNEQEAFDVAKSLSEKLALRIWDATEREGKFIN